MQTQTASSGKRRAKVEAENSEPKVMKLDAVRDKLGHLKQLCRSKNETATDYAEAVEAVATAAGLNKAALASFVAAAVSDKAKEKRERARQLSLLFEEIGA